MFIAIMTSTVHEVSPSVLNNTIDSFVIPLVSCNVDVSVISANLPTVWTGARA